MKGLIGDRHFGLGTGKRTATLLIAVRILDGMLVSAGHLGHPSELDI
jgi:hypothetical protein